MCNTVGTSVNLEAGCLFVVMVVFFFHSLIVPGCLLSQLLFCNDNIFRQQYHCIAMFTDG